MSGMRGLDWTVRALVLAALLAATVQPAAAQLTVGVGDPFPDFAAYDQDNAPFSLADYDGKILLLHVAAFSCVPCIAFAGDEQAITDRLDSLIDPASWALVDVLAENAFGGPSDAWDAFTWKAFFLSPSRTLHASGLPASDVALLPGVLGLVQFPTYFVLDPTGRITAIHQGYDAGDPNDALDSDAAVLVQLVLDAADGDEEDDPLGMLESLIDQTAGIGMTGKTTVSLLAKLTAARRVLADGNPANDKAAIGSLGAFINQVRALSGKSLSVADAATLTSAAYAVIVALGE